MQFYLFLMAILYYLFILGSVSVEHVDSGVAVVGLLVIAKSCLVDNYSFINIYTYIRYVHIHTQ